MKEKLVSNFVSKNLHPTAPSQTAAPEMWEEAKHLSWVTGRWGGVFCPRAAWGVTPSWTQTVKEGCPFKLPFPSGLLTPGVASCSFQVKEGLVKRSCPTLGAAGTSPSGLAWQCNNIQTWPTIPTGALLGLEGDVVCPSRHRRNFAEKPLQNLSFEMQKSPLSAHVQSSNRNRTHTAFLLLLLKKKTKHGIVSFSEP